MILRFFTTLLAALILAGCGGSKETAHDAAVKFFTLCAEGKITEAYRNSASTFRLERSEKYFTARVRDLHLDHPSKQEWGSAEVRGAVTLQPATITTEAEEMRLTVSLVQEAGAWRVLNVKRQNDDKSVEEIFDVIARSADSKDDRAREFGEPTAATIPGAHALHKLVETTLLDFQAAITARDFSGFYETASNRWKFRGKDPRFTGYTGTDPAKIAASDPNNTAGRLTVGALTRSFQGFIAAGVDLSAIKEQVPKFEPEPSVNSDGVLTVSGVYPSFVFQGNNPPVARKMDFRLEYVREGAQWRMFGITVNLRAPGQ